jgi:hypothetical protein
MIAQTLGERAAAPRLPSPVRVNRMKPSENADMPARNFR